MMFFRSERLFLRPGWPEDWSDLFRQIADEQIVRNLARAPWPYRPEDAREFAALVQDRRFPHFFITLPQAAGGNELIGCIGLHRFGEGAADLPELGFWIARRRWGQGYATEAGRAMLAIARTLGHRCITAVQFADNPASGRVLARLGFRPTGTSEQRYSLARGEAAPAHVHLAELAGASGGGDCGGGDGAMPRAA
ncbi:MAG TPA: GNAT family protein [Novosphingobium sp.]|nr:GNAT family protein [Novosphingobium sp.]